MDVLSLALGLILLVAGVVNLIKREEVAQRLAAAYSKSRSPSWYPAILSRRFGIRETRIIAILVTMLFVSVGVWFIIGGAIA